MYVQYTGLFFFLFSFLAKTCAYPPNTASFIHGGAWRDPTQTKAMGHGLLQYLVTASSNGLNAASIDYRLSLHPHHAPVGETVVHPAHLEDVQSALGFLCDSYGMRNYILVGHSAGATLALQVLAATATATAAAEARALPLAKGVVCLEGIYDLPHLVKEYPDYRGFVEGAFGPVSAEDDEKEDGSNETPPHPWAITSPTRSPICRGFAPFFDADAFPGAFILVHSEQDELLSLKQTRLMQKALSRMYSSAARVDTFIGEFGGHNDVLADKRVWNIVGGLVWDVLSALNP